MPTPQYVPLPADGNLVRCYHSTDGGIPAEVQALGKADSLHTPWKLLLMARRNQTPFVIAGAIIVLLVAVLILSGKAPSGPLGVLNFVVIFLGGGLIALPFMDRNLPSYLVFDDALVMVVDDAFTVLPWTGLVALDPGRMLVTIDGQRCEIPTSIENMGRLHGAVQGKLRQRLLVPALEAIGRGEKVTFGPVTLSNQEIGYKEKSLPWSEVGSVKIIAGSSVGYSALNVWQRGAVLLPWGMIELNRMSNDWLFLEVFKQVCPERLLEKATE